MNKTNKIIRFSAILAIGAIGAFGLAACNKNSATGGGNSKFEIANDITQGSKDAKVVMVEYASVTCPHCADFQKNVIPEIKAKYVETGKVRFAFREYPTPPVEIAMAGHLLARCVASDKHEAVISALMNTQMEIITQSQGPNGAKQSLLNVAKSVGMNEADFDKCMENKEKLKVLADIMEHGNTIDKVGGTPTILINGKTITPPPGQDYTPKLIADAIEAELAKAGAAK